MPSELERRAAASITKEKRTARDVIIANGEQLEKALGQAIPVDHFIRGALTVLNGNVELQTVTEASLMGSLLLAAQLGLEIGNGLNQFHLTPRDVKPDRDSDPEHVCVPIIGYQGFVTLAYRHVKTLDFNLIRIYEGDRFEEGYTSERGKFFEWAPLRTGDRGRYTGGLIASRTAGGGRIETYLTFADIDARRPAYTKPNERGWMPNTPWKTNPLAMADKTVMREHWKFVPKSVQMQHAYALDGRVVRQDEETEQLTAALSYEQEFGQAEPEEVPQP